MPSAPFVFYTLGMPTPCLALALRVQDQRDNKAAEKVCQRVARFVVKEVQVCSPVKTQNFAEDQNQDHAHEDPALIHVGSNALVTDDTNAVASRETSHADGHAARKMHEAAEQAVARLGVQVLGDEDGYDERVDGDDTGHDYGDEALAVTTSISDRLFHEATRAPARERKEQRMKRTFMMRSGLNVPTPAMPIPDLAVP